MPSAMALVRCCPTCCECSSRCVCLMQEDFEMAVAKVMKKDSDKNMSLRKLFK